ncbi:MAG: RNA polymerase sigma factor [Acidobacteriaceae bacterium]|nr:RNA polymerase sigma factor [Acidobacteriaceae bacterium]
MPLFQAAAILAGVREDRARLDEHAFRRLHDQTVHSLRAYLHRIAGDGARADDLLQETYLRLLEAKFPAGMEPQHLKNYLFRTATNLARTEFARRKAQPLGDHDVSASSGDNVHARIEVQQFLEQLPPKHRELLWLAYVERFSHEEIAAVVGAKTASIRPMLSRARAKLSEVLNRGGVKPPEGM